MMSPALMVTALLLVLLSSALASSQALRSQAPEGQPGAGSPGEDPRPHVDEGDNLLKQSLMSSHPPAGAWRVVGDASSGSRSPSKAMANLPLGSGDQNPPSKLQRLLPQLYHRRSLGLSHHLKGYGKFNGDTHSCHRIQSRPCHKPSDCGGCLGLYTCKLPAGTCELKAVSRQRGVFLQSIRSPEGRRVLLIPQQHSST